MSIGKSQAKLLADSYLNDLGDDPTAFKPVNTFLELIVIAGELVEDAQKNLISSNSISSGTLSKSIEAEEPVTKGKIISVPISMEFYGLFVNGGVKGTKKGSGQYRFKGDRPPLKMVDSIRDWMKTGGNKTMNTNKKKSSFKQEVKNSSISELDSAYAVARSILQKGIKRTKFLDKAVDKASKKASDVLGDAFTIDIITTLKAD